MAQGGGVAGVMGNGGADGGREAAMNAALSALVAAIERRLRARGVMGPPDALLLGAYRHTLIAALQRQLLERVAVLHWPTFYRLSAVLCRNGLEGLHAAVALSLPEALAAGVTGAVLDTLAGKAWPCPLSVAFRRLTRPTGGHVVFRSQLLRLVEREFRMMPLELASLLARHTPAAVAAMLHARLIARRPDLDSPARQTLLAHTVRHLGQLLPEDQAARTSLLLLRVVHYRLHQAGAASAVLRRLRIVDFRGRRAATGAGKARADR
ncbi:MAG: hypothetical protein ACE5I7_14605 [Candidatus Binatia bacterium]